MSDSSESSKDNGTRGSNIYRPYVDLSSANPALLSPYLPPINYETGNSSFNPVDGYETQGNSVTKELATYAVMKFLTTAMASPFEVAHTLLQVQNIPLSQPPSEEKDEDSEEEYSDSEEELYRAPKQAEDMLSIGTLTPGKKIPTDRLGYVVQTPTEEEATRPSYQVPTLMGGIWSTMGSLIKHPTEGFLSLWKGQFTYWMYDMSHLFLQPTLEGALNDTFDLYDDTIPLVHLDTIGPNIATLVLSHLAVGLFLNPLEIVRTRLIVQSASPDKVKYNGPFHALLAIIQEEGYETLYWGKDILPSALYHLFTPLFQHCTPLIIDRWFHISPSDAPLLYSFAELALNTLQLMITLPLDTIRKRLHVQLNTRASPQRPFLTAVRTRQAPYANSLDCALKLITEERVPKPSKLHPASFYIPHGIGALYRGFNFHATSNLVTTTVSSLTGIKDDGDW